MNTSQALVRLESAIKNTQMLWMKTTFNDFPVFRHILDSVMFFNMTDDAIHFLLGVIKSLQCLRHRSIDNFEHTATRKQFVFHERDIRLNTSGVTVHQESNRSRWSQNGDLRVTVTMLHAMSFSMFPTMKSFLFQVIKFLTGLNSFCFLFVETNHFEHRLDIVFLQGLAHASTTGVFITGKRAHNT